MIGRLINVLLWVFGILFIIPYTHIRIVPWILKGIETDPALHICYTTLFICGIIALLGLILSIINDIIKYIDGE